MFVVICRYVTSQQLRWIEQSRPLLAGVVLFVDDDLASIVSGCDGTLRYKLRLIRVGIRPLLRLNKMLDAVWVSTSELSRRFERPGHVPLVVAPFPEMFQPSLTHNKENSQKPLKLVYHATGIHHREHDFLRPIVMRAMEQHTSLHFEVIADGKLAEEWQKLDLPKDRFKLRSGLSWPDYVSFTATEPADIALVPLLDSRTNNCRSDTKRIDVARMKAAAIFSKSETFDRCATDGELHVENTPDAWLSAIDILVKDQNRRTTARNATLGSLEKMRQMATPHFPLEFFESRKKNQLKGQ
ncbi:hypothetical protein N7E02_19445 [Aliirhizobium terrae]|uniref:hypothetical protein n=1 Tax=Terrirhizobium terrae TaxID=2926709 RepID=UPI0025753904|nr:hypothetical protein [Rhizobium sp. CC-CFT758]WJH39065.1 hypothetical protein N7E02_19445 [Rhizobium sp. CC-CFT758]